MRALLVGLLLGALCGCGSGGDFPVSNVAGNATLSNGTVNGTVSIQTPLGTFTYPGPQGPSPSGSVAASPSP